MTDNASVLIVEDSHTQAELLKYILEAHRYTVRVVHDGGEGLEAARRDPPDLIISDIIMPVMDGYELCRRIKADKKLRHIPVILVTTLSEPEDVIRGLECGADNFIRKPYQPEYLLTRVKDLLLTQRLRNSTRVQLGIKLHFGGKEYVVDADRRQILDLLISTFESAVAQNRELLKVQSELKIKNKQLEEQARQLHRAIAAAEDASRAKSAFLANMSHELRTPLNGVIGMLELLKHTDLSEEQQEYLSIAETSAQSLLHIINDILDLSRIEAGKVTLSPERFEFRRWLEESLRPLRASAEQKGLSFVCEVAEGVPEYVVGDPLRLRQILVNLVGNAIKFTQAGSIAVRVSVDEAGKQDVEGARRVALRFVVQDTGVGIPPEKLEHIFDRFEQVDDSLTRSHQGTGLGLAISRHLVEMMGGRIWAESPALPAGQPSSAAETVPPHGPGSAFYFTVLLEAASLPEDAEAEPHPASAAPETAAPVAEQAGEHPPPEDRLSREAPSPSRLRILLAEDNRINQRVAQRMLEKMGHEVIIAANGKEAVELLEKESVDVVLMDVQMPEMDGFTATEIIRQREKETGKHVPIIALTAHAMKGDRERCLEAGMDGYLTKPLKQKALRQALAQLVSPVSVEDPKLHAAIS